MSRAVPRGYFYSQEPFWETLSAPNIRFSPEGDFMLMSSSHTEQWISCIPGNGQIGTILRYVPGEVKGTCYGILKEPRLILLHGQTEREENVYILRFATGSFSRICRVPLNRLDPEGIDITHIFSKEQLEQLKQLSESQQQEEELFQLVTLWLSRDDSRIDTTRTLTDEVIYRIWSQKGNIRVQELENATLYSSRYLEKLLVNNVGLTPKQLCSQMRFQHSIRMLRNLGSISQAELALLLGYSDQAHFCRTFRKLSGITPLEFMNRHSNLIL